MHFFIKIIKKTLNKKRFWQINKSNEEIPSKNYCLNMYDNVWGLRLFMKEFIIAVKLSHFMQEFIRFSGILAGLAG